MRAAEGLCELGMWEEAWEELETLGLEPRAAPDVIRMRLGILVTLERYESAAILAESMVAKGDESPETWLQGSWSIRRARSIADARAFLERGEAFLSTEALYHYNLACYSCQLGDIAATKERLTRAFNLDSSFRKTALDDEDLLPVW